MHFITKLGMEKTRSTQEDSSKCMSDSKIVQQYDPILDDLL